MILNTKRIHNSFSRNFPQELNNYKLKFYLSARKSDDEAIRSLRAKIVIIGNNKRVKNHILVLNYLTVLVYTKTILFTSLSVASSGNLP